MLAKLKSLFVSLLVVVGFGCICFGIWELSPAAGKISVGVSLLLLGYLGELGSRMPSIGTDK